MYIHRKFKEWEVGYEKLKRYNFKREGNKAEGVFVHAKTLEEATLKANSITDGKLFFVDNKPCPKNVGCCYCFD